MPLPKDFIWTIAYFSVTKFIWGFVKEMSRVLVDSVRGFYDLKQPSPDPFHCVRAIIIWHQGQIFSFKWFNNSEAFWYLRIWKKKFSIVVIQSSQLKWLSQYIQQAVYTNFADSMKNVIKSIKGMVKSFGMFH